MFFKKVEQSFKNLGKIFRLGSKVLSLTHFKPIDIQKQFSHVDFLKLSYFKPIIFLIKNFTQKCEKMNVHERFNHKMTNLDTMYQTSSPFHTK